MLHTYRHERMQSRDHRPAAPASSVAFVVPAACSTPSGSPMEQSARGNVGRAWKVQAGPIVWFLGLPLVGRNHVVASFGVAQAALGRIVPAAIGVGQLPIGGAGVGGVGGSAFNRRLQTIPVLSGMCARDCRCS